MNSFPLHRSLTAAFSPARRIASSGVSEDGEIPDHNYEDDDDDDYREDSLLNIKQILRRQGRRSCGQDRC